MLKRLNTTLAKPNRISVKLHIICGKRKATNERRITITDRHEII